MEKDAGMYVCMYVCTCVRVCVYVEQDQSKRRAGALLPDLTPVTLREHELHGKQMHYMSTCTYRYNACI